MNPRHSGRGLRIGTALALALAILAATARAPASASDHDDTLDLRNLARHDARITDFYAFARGDRLVLVVCTDPTVPAGATSYMHPADLTLRVHVDRHSAVRFDDPEAMAEFGGTVVEPGRIAADVVFEVTFDRGSGDPRVRIEDLPGRVQRELRVFAGLRDDPFIRGPRTGRNVAALVLEVPLDAVRGESTTLLLWATSKIPALSGSTSEHAGRALRSQFIEHLLMNAMHPRDHLAKLGVPPDVVIYDTTRPARFPNGRALEDDVVDLVGDARVLVNDAPYPSANDRPFLAEFPYLAEPH